MLSQHSYYIFSQLFLAFANWILLAVIARSFSMDETGAYNLILAIHTPVFLLFSFHLRNHFLSRKDLAVGEFSPYMALRVASLAPILVVSFTCAYLLDVLGGFFWGVFLLKTSEFLFELPFMNEHKRDKLGRASLRHLGRTIVVYAPLCWLIHQGNSALVSFGVAGTAGIFYSLGYLGKVVVANDEKLAVSLKGLVALGRGAAGLGVSAAVLSLNVSLPRFYLAETLGKDATAVYSVSFAFYGVWQLVFNSYLNALLPRFGEADVREKLLAPLGALGLFAVFFLLFDESVYQILFGPLYAGASNLTPGLLTSIALSFGASFFFYSLMAKGDYSSHLRYNLFSVLLNASLLWPCIRYFGIQGAYLSWSLSLGLLCGLYLFNLRRTGHGSIRKHAS